MARPISPELTLWFTEFSEMLSVSCTVHSPVVHKIRAPVRESRSTAPTCFCNLLNEPNFPPHPATGLPLPHCAAVHLPPIRSLPRAVEPLVTESRSHAAIRSPGLAIPPQTPRAAPPAECASFFPRFPEPSLCNPAAHSTPRASRRRSF